MAREKNVTGKCQVCGVSLSGLVRVDKMVCGVKFCRRAMTKFNRDTKEFVMPLPPIVRRKSRGEEAEGMSFHVRERYIQIFKLYVSMVSQAIMRMEEMQRSESRLCGMEYSSQSDMFVFTAVGDGSVGGSFNDKK